MAQTMDYSRSGGRPGFTIRNPDGTTKFVSMDELEKQGTKDQFLKDLERNTGKTFQQWEDSWLQRRGQEQLKKDDASLKPKPKPAVPPAVPAKPKPAVPPAEPAKPKPVPVKSTRQQELDKINADKTLTPEQKWEKANPGLAAARRERKAIRGTSETDNPLMQGLRSGLPAAKTALDTTAFKADLAQSGIKPSAYSSLLNNPRRMKYQQPSVEAYDVVLDYLLSEGHADTVEEAHYVMMQMDSEYIQSIVEAGEGRVNLTYPAGHPKYGQPMEVDGKPMSVSKRTADWNSKMNRYKEQNPEGYKKAKGMMGPYGWSEPPKGYNPPNWM